MKLDFLGVGPMRAGTTWLHDNLVRHAEVCLPETKETFFFDRQYGRGVDWFERHFTQHKPGATYGEIGASYFHAPEVSQRVFSLAPECRILVSVRDPVGRAWSNYLHYLRRGRVPESLPAAAAQYPAILEASRYASHVPRWIDTFGEGQVHLVSLDAIIADPVRTLNDVTSFLGVAPMPSEQVETSSSNAGYTPRSRIVQRSKQALYRFLRRRHLFGPLRALRTMSRAVDDRARFLSKRDAPPPRMSEADATWLEERLGDDIAFLQRLEAGGHVGWRSPTDRERTSA